MSAWKGAAMRRGFVALLAVLSLLLVLFGSTPAAANSYPNLYEYSWKWTEPGTGDVYQLKARITTEVTTSGSQGRFRLRLECLKTDSDTGGTAHNPCIFQWTNAPYNAFWCFGRPDIETCYTRGLDSRYDPDGNELWYGSWHNLSTGVTYAVQAVSFRAVFNAGNGHVGAWHAICSYKWTKGGSRGGLLCLP
jgi:hypothetical protein